jgi:hypothetical protein
VICDFKKENQRQDKRLRGLRFRKSSLSANECLVHSTVSLAAGFFVAPAPQNDIVEK